MSYASLQGTGGMTKKRDKHVHSMFGPARSKRLSSIVTLKSPGKAVMAAGKLRELFEHARTREFKVKVKRATVLAANRAEAMTHKKNLSRKERNELKRIAAIYRRAAKHMNLPPRK